MQNYVYIMDLQDFHGDVQVILFFLDKYYAIKIIEKVIETEHKELKELLYLDTVINIECVFSIFPELNKIGYRFIGLNAESECLYGDAGLG